MRRLEFSSAFRFSKMKPAYVENETSQKTYADESNSTPSRVRHLSRECIKNDWKDEKPTGQLIGPTPYAGFAMNPCSSLRVGSGRRLGSPCLWDRDQTAGETNCCIAQVTSNDILVQNAHFLCEDGTS